MLIDFDHADPDFHNNPDDQETTITATKKMQNFRASQPSLMNQTWSINLTIYLLNINNSHLPNNTEPEHHFFWAIHQQIVLAAKRFARIPPYRGGADLRNPTF